MATGENHHSVPDFTRLDCQDARIRVAQLVRVGLSDYRVADLVGWDVIDVRRAASERQAVPP
jgi:hypothetical protein